jgi:hypothetical protein
VQALHHNSVNRKKYSIETRNAGPGEETRNAGPGAGRADGKPGRIMLYSLLGYALSFCAGFDPLVMKKLHFNTFLF